MRAQDPTFIIHHANGVRLSEELINSPGGNYRKDSTETRRTKQLFKKNSCFIVSRQASSAFNGIVDGPRTFQPCKRDYTTARSTLERRELVNALRLQN
jgi:hypothetical protein